MKMDKANIRIRPRTSWESMDLGILLGRKHATSLIKSWLIATISLYLILLPFLWQSPGWIMFIIWWLKPIFERIPLQIISSAIFGVTPTTKKTLGTWLKGLKSLLIYDLTLGRFYLARSFILPIKHLEGSRGKALVKRMRLLNRSRNHSGWLTIIFMHIEMLLMIGAMLLIHFMIPNSETAELFLEEYLSGDNFAIMHLSVVLYLLILAITEPLYVACGFSLYLNRRIILEGWDIELALRRLANRLAKSTLIIFIALGVTFSALPDWAMADPIDSEHEAYLIERDENRETIKKIIDSPPFYEKKETTHYRFKRREDVKDDQPNVEYRERRSYEGGFPIASLLEIVAWGTLIAFVIWIVFKVIQTPPRIRMSGTKIAPPEEFQGMSIKPESLPKDILTAFNQSWPSSRREALSLLYRALLSHLVHQHRIPLNRSHTEEEVVMLAKKLDDDRLINLTQTVTIHWQNLAYAHLEPEDDIRQELMIKWEATILQQDRDI